MKIRNRSIRFGLLLSVASLTAMVSHAAAPVAGSKIGNQASATYQNAAGDTISITSNKVETIVQQVAGLTLLTDNTENVGPGGKVFLPHTISNDGNGTDSFALTAEEEVGGPFDFTNISIFPDANFDGVADSTTPISSTPVLAPGESFGFVIEATVPRGASVGASETIEVDAVSNFDSDVKTDTTTDPTTNVDTITISNGAITEIVKSMTVTDTSGDNRTGPGDTVTITLTYSSTGLAIANNLVITDQLDQYLTYVDDSGVWSDSSDPLTDGDEGYELSNANNFQIDYQYDDVDTVQFQIDSVPRGRTATVTFQATINADAPAGDIPNIATQEVDGTAFPPSNEAIVTVDQTYAVSAADATASTYVAGTDGPANLDAGGASATDDDGALNDIVEENTNTSQGGQVAMEFVITNHANVTDTVDLTFANDATNGFPDGTTFQLVGADGATPIVGPLGPLASGSSQTVNIIATFPPDVPTADAGDTNYAVELTAQSSNGGLPNSVTGLFTGAILGETVDLTNTDETGPTEGAGPDDGSTLLTNATDPGTPTTFPLTVTNSGSTASTYDLSLAVPLPPGWTVKFELPDGTPVTNTGVIPGGDSQDIVVVVTPPSDEAPGDTPVQVAVVSPTSGQGDTLINEVTVNEVTDVSLTADQTVQVAPGGIADIPHVLTNEGNIAITEGALTPATTGGFDTFSGTLFWDVNGNGEADSTDVVVDNIDDIGSIAPGESVNLIHRVQVPSSGAIGVNETETLTLATVLNGGTKTDSDPSDNAVTDTAIIVSGDLTLVKMQAVDPGCTGTIVGSFVTADVAAEPGQCIRYQITANNTGTADADVVTIKDTIPGFTTLTECAGDCEITVTPAGSSVTTQPLEGSGGALESDHGTLIPGAPATLEFTVKIDE